MFDLDFKVIKMIKIESDTDVDSKKKKNILIDEIMMMMAFEKPFYQG
jgi:hypothetical protein